MPGGLPERIGSEYQRRFPHVEIPADSGSTVHNLERLQAAELDVAFVHTPFETRTISGASTSPPNRW